MEDLTLFLVSILASCMAFYLIVSQLSPRPVQKHLQSPARVLFITSHPDDEVMFFGPTILGLAKTGCEIFLLVMSPGREKGHTRKKELYESCRILGIPMSNIIVMRHTKLKDDPTVRWREELVSNIILRHVASLNIDTVVTFDRHGISGHRNHVSLFYAVACFAMEVCNMFYHTCSVFNSFITFITFLGQRQISLLLDHCQPAEEVQLGAGCPHELLGVSLGVHSWGGSVVGPAKSHDGPQESVYLV